MLLLDLADGTSVGITDHDSDLVFDIGDGAKTYQSDTGIFTSNVALSCGLDADNYEVTGPVNDDFTIAGLLGGKFNNARARLFQVNWRDLSAGAIKLMAGDVREARIEGGKFTLEIRSDIDRYNQTVGRVITNQCWKDFADGVNCTATATEITGTVTAVNDAMHFIVSFSGSYADDFFNMGTVIGLTGVNAGTTVEIEDWTSLGAIVLFSPLAEEPAIGDTFTVRNGCSKLRLSSVVGVPTCKTYNNVVQFGGYPEVPGSDQVLKTAFPGQGNG
jgi:uncharacterized phage protein (TIGR02218 family)